jgi:hypothetical protein
VRGKDEMGIFEKIESLEEIKSAETETLNFLLNKRTINLSPELAETITPKDFPRISNANARTIAIGQGIISASLLADALLAIACLIETGITLTVALVVGFTFFGTAFVLAFCAYGRNKMIEEEHHILRTLQATRIKLAILNELITRKKAEVNEEIKKFKEDNQKVTQTTPALQQQLSTPLMIENLANSQPENQKNSSSNEKQSSKENPKVPFYHQFLNPLFMKPLIRGLALSSVLFASFFWCAAVVASALGLATIAAMLFSPIGVVIGIAVSIALGISYAQQNYTRVKILQEQEQQNEKADEEFEHLNHEYKNLENKRKKIGLLQKNLKNLEYKSNDLPELISTEAISTALTPSQTTFNSPIHHLPPKNFNGQNFNGRPSQNSKMQLVYAIDL